MKKIKDIWEMKTADVLVVSRHLKKIIKKLINKLTNVNYIYFAKTFILAKKTSPSLNDNVKTLIAAAASAST